MAEDPERGLSAAEEKADAAANPGGVSVKEEAPPIAVHGGDHPAHHLRHRSGPLRLGSLENWRWDSGNREGGHEDPGSLAGSLSRDGSREGSRRGPGSAYERSRHGGSSFGGSRHGGSNFELSRHGGSHYGDGGPTDLERSYRASSNYEGSRHGASRLREGSHHGGVHYGPGGVPVAHEGAHHHHHHHNGIPGPLHPNGTSPFFELPGQGGPLQDGAGLSIRSMRATAPHSLPEDSSESGSGSGSGSGSEGGSKEHRPEGFWEHLHHYVFKRLYGHLDTAHPRPSHWWGLIVMPIGAFLGILYVAGVDYRTMPAIDMRVLAPSFGASAVLVFAVPESKLSQPRNFLGGQFLSSIVGCVVRQIFPQHLSWVSAAVGVAAAIFVMIVTRTVHPPGGATALMIASLQPKGKWDSWIYVPAIMIGSIGMQIIALFMNLITPGRAYPTFWWGSDNFFGGL